MSIQSTGQEYVSKKCIHINVSSPYPHFISPLALFRAREEIFEDSGKKTRQYPWAVHDVTHSVHGLADLHIQKKVPGVQGAVARDAFILRMAQISGLGPGEVCSSFMACAQSPWATMGMSATARSMLFSIIRRSFGEGLLRTWSVTRSAEPG